ncbi:MAG TPA: riboflavin synthase [Acidobacteriaceae bacterium]|nr:riboflavin synthase [Acidobacteriaceae bacterium]
MFTGLIEATGTIRCLETAHGNTRITVAGPADLVRRLHTGDSVSVSGVCLTALDINIDSNLFSADLAAETIARTSLLKLHSGSIVNLELPTPAGTPLGGHVVQGHVDGVGIVQSLQPASGNEKRAAADWRLRLSVPEECARYIVAQGSITIEGISLTVASVKGTAVEIAVIPHTYAVTNVHTLSAGSLVNIEVDVMAKYAERLSGSPVVQEKRDFELTLEYLIANGY